MNCIIWILLFFVIKKFYGSFGKLAYKIFKNKISRYAVITYLVLLVITNSFGNMMYFKLLNELVGCDHNYSRLLIRSVECDENSELVLNSLGTNNYYKVQMKFHISTIPFLLLVESNESNKYGEGSSEVLVLWYIFGEKIVKSSF